jgi:osmoprotectant transport system substrate-binding protein
MMACVHDRIAGLLLCAGILFGCGITAGCRHGEARRLAVGAKSSPSGVLLGEILVQHLHKQLGNLQITRRQTLGNTLSAHDALMSGEVDLYPETAASALVSVFHLPEQDTPEVLLAQLRERYEKQLHCQWIGPLGFSETRTLVLRRELSTSEGVRTLSQASEYQPGWAILAQSDFQTEADGLGLLLRHYPLRLSRPVQIENQLGATGAEDAQLLAGRASDWSTGDERYVVLEDDKHALPPYDIGIVVKQETLDAVPGLGDALRALNGKITLQRMRDMRHRVESDQSTAEVVVTQFLKEAGL